MIIEFEINGARVKISGDNLSISILSTEVEAAPVSKAHIFPLPAHVVFLADAFCAKTGLAASTVSTQIFNDGKRIERLRSGLGITVQSYNDALAWFSANWPNGLVWPHDVPRPEIVEAAE
jgi:hypothetical protein